MERSFPRGVINGCFEGLLDKQAEAQSWKQTQAIKEKRKKREHKLNSEPLKAHNAPKAAMFFSPSNNAAGSDF